MRKPLISFWILHQPQFEPLQTQKKIAVRLLSKHCLSGLKKRLKKEKQAGAELGQAQPKLGIG